MSTEAFLTGSFPRSEDLIASTREFDRGRITAEELERHFAKDRESLISVQVQAGLPTISDGLLNWQDLLRPLARSLSNVRVGPLTRWFNNNTFYRQPIIEGKVRLKEWDEKRYFHWDLLPKDRLSLATLPGPYTFAVLSENKFYSERRDLITDVGEALGTLARGLASRGYRAIEFCEPSLVVTPPGKELLDHVVHVLSNITLGLKAKTILHTYFGDFRPLYPKLLDLPINALGIDFYETEARDLGDWGFSKELVCGLVDGRNSLVESPKQLVEFASKIRDTLEPKALHLSSNSDMEYLPRTVAEKKVQSLGKAVSLLQGG